MKYTVFFDFETGGIEDSRPEIQLAAIAVDENWNEVETFEQKIAFDEAAAAPDALKINHYDREAWKDALQPPAVAAKFARFIEKYKSIEMISKRTGAPYMVARLAGHNAATFDGPRLRRMFSNQFLPAHPMPLCTLQRALWHFHETGAKIDSFKLESLCKYFGIECEGAHDALKDVRMTVKLAKALCVGAAQEVRS